MLNKFTRLAAVALGAAAFAGAFAAQAPAQTSVKLTILGVGDLYNFAGDPDRGGFARLNAVAKAEMAANPNTIYV
ncbi:MAG TPA: bifunctional metallophosphatase/5'-nucleotidase, partial [Devosiaceae bacterium]|nr:bifunctional metallophosphatase/5'-nucleotidase [Devosiaceae bacterium]